MDTSIRDITKKRGRPKTTGKGLGLLVRLQPPELARLDAWIAGQPVSRPEAIRRILADALEKPATKPVQSDASLDQQIALQKAVIAEMPEHSEPSPEAGMATMDKALAQKDLIDLKNKRTRRKNAKLK